MIKPSEEIFTDSGLEYRKFEPERSSTLVFFVHGRAGDHSVMWTFSRTLRELEPEPVILAPQAFLPDKIGGYSWWPVGTTEEEVRELEKTQLENINIAADKLSAFVRRAKEKYQPERTIYYGFSQGGGLGTTLSLREPELFDAVCVLAGFIPRKVLASLDAGFEFAGKPPKYFIAHGSADKIVTVKRAETAKEFFESKGAEVTMHIDDVGHKVGSAGMNALKDFINNGF